MFFPQLKSGRWRGRLSFAIALLAVLSTHTVGAFAQVSKTATRTPTPRATATPLPAAPDNSLITNASRDDVAAAQEAVDGMARSVSAKDAAALRLLQLTENERKRLNAASAPYTRAIITHLALSDNKSQAKPETLSRSGALTRVEIRVLQSRDESTVLLSCAIDLWLERLLDGGFALTDKNWRAPDDAALLLAAQANVDWKIHSKLGTITDLIAERRGGRWIPLRISTIWSGPLLDEENLKETALHMLSIGDVKTADDASPQVETPWDFSPWLSRKMAELAEESDKNALVQGCGTAHFLLQRDSQGWVALDAVWESNRSLEDTNFVAAEKAARRDRKSLETKGYLLAETHRNLGVALLKLGLYDEAADELQKSEAMQNGSVGEVALKAAEALRARDPQRVAFAQVAEEQSLGTAADHPLKMAPRFETELRTRPSALTALRLGMEYSRLGYDDSAEAMLQTASSLGPASMQNAGESDRAWTDLLLRQLRERGELARKKPPLIIRSALFMVRCWPNDLNAVRLLAGLEAAQHTIYADFGIPMSNTEVVMWRSQNEFQKYTGTRVGKETSEFVTALTMTQLVNTEKGPHVLGEEINFYADAHASSLSTIAHEYGHIAVRQLAQGRFVPDWLNEGIATTVEGGYEDGIARVRTAAKRGNLLSMKEMRAWDVDGERAFLAYSQANSMIDFMKEKWGSNALLEILREIGRDTPPDDAVQKVLKISTDALWNTWRQEGIK